MPRGGMYTWIEYEALIKVGNYVEVVSFDRKKVLWEVVENHVLKEVKDHDEIWLQGFGFNYFDKDEEGVLDKDWVGILI